MFDLYIKKLFLIFYLIRTNSIALQNDIDLKQNENSQLEETASGIVENNIARFQREELFKHNALRDCKQKLTLTVKACSEPGQDSGDEYIPIEHVLGANRKRIRLLHPYVLRLKRQMPCQVYKLRRIDTVIGVIGVHPDKRVFSNSSERLQHDTQPKIYEDRSAFSPVSGLNLHTLDQIRSKRSFSIKLRGPKKSRKTKFNSKLSTDSVGTCGDKNIRHQTNESLLHRKKLSKREIKNYEEEFFNKWTSNDGADVNLEKNYNFDDEYEHLNPNNLNNVELHHKTVQSIRTTAKKSDRLVSRKTYSDSSESIEHKAETERTSAMEKKGYLENSRNVKEEKNYAVFAIGDPDLYYNAEIQLFEKLSTPEGKTMWNDLTKDEIARVSSIRPEWSDEDMNVKYKPIDWLPREEFTLPHKRLCLLVPLKVDTDNAAYDKHRDFIIVPNDDVITVNDDEAVNKRDKRADNLSDTSTEESTIKQRRRVVVRVARALMRGSASQLKLIARGTDHFLKLPHTRRHHAQIDIEGKADDNELVLVGAFGRLTMIVSDTTRKSRSVITVQATNTGLAAARFRVLTRECNPELSNEDVGRNEKAVAGPVLLPPRHSGTFRLNIPVEFAIESAHCVVALVNQDDESVAIRDVRIKRDDRCFCVWHCDCVCLSDDPKLLCRGLTEAQMAAAGLSIKDRSRHTRSVCYPDVVTLNLFVTCIGVLLALLLLGAIKAFLGLILRCVGLSGLHLLFQKPPKLDHYYEGYIRDRDVIYGSDGWPVHPDSKERNVRFVSIPMEFVLNLIFFIILPCVIIWDAISRCLLRFKSKEQTTNECCRRNNTKKCFSTHDIQGARRRTRRRRDVLRRWMTPHAEELSTDIWKESFSSSGSTMSLPLLRDKNCCLKTNDASICSDSDQEDTEYVLMQMQKSRESLAKCQPNLEDEQFTSQGNKHISNVTKK